MKTTEDYTKRERLANQIASVVIAFIVAGFIGAIVLIVKFATVITLA